MRRLPDDPGKRRLQYFKRLYQHLEHFWSLIENGEMEMPGIVMIWDEDKILPEEEIYLPDMLVGIDSLPPRQRQAFELICLQGFTEGAATDVMLPHSKWSTPIQQYADSALARMVEAYDQKQAGTWVPKVYVKRTKACAVKGPVVNRKLTLDELNAATIDLDEAKEAEEMARVLRRDEPGVTKPLISA